MSHTSVVSGLRSVVMFYILHGEDELACSDHVAEFRQKIGDETTRDLNTTLLDGRKVTLAELRHAADAIPFLSDKRLVIVEGLLTRLASSRHKGDEGGEPSGASREFQKALLEYLPEAPDSTRLVFVEPRSLPATNPVLKLALETDRRSVRHLPLPPKNNMAGWVQKRARLHSGEFTSPAAGALVVAVGYDPHPSDRDRTPEQGNKLRLLDQEIQKLLMYVNWSRAVTPADVQLLVSEAQQGDLFGMIDALAEGKGQKAIVELHRLIDRGKAPLELFGMIVRQFRLMIQVKELGEQGLNSAAIVERLSLHPFVAEKTGRQAQAFSMEQLELIYHRLQEMDVQIKTGQVEDVTALDLLVAGLAG
jgi:DNA polymerase-3 subunit delta